MYAKAHGDLAQVTSKLAEDLIMKELKILTSLLGIGIYWHGRAAYLRQNGLIGKLLEDSQIETLNLVKSPISNDHGLHPNYNGTDFTNGESTGYRSIARSLIYIALKIQPDLCAAASVLGTPAVHHRRCIWSLLRERCGI